MLVNVAGNPMMDARVQFVYISFMFNMRITTTTSITIAKPLACLSNSSD